MRSIYLIILLFFLLIQHVYPEGLMGLEAFGMKTNNVSENLSESIANNIKTKLICTGRYRAIEKSQIELILNEGTFYPTRCLDIQYNLNIGKQLYAKMIQFENVEKDGRILIITNSIYDNRESNDYSLNEGSLLEDMIEEDIDSIACELIAQLDGVKNNDSSNKGMLTVKDVELDNVLGAFIESAIPGLTQMLHGDYFSKLEGTLFMLGTLPFTYFTYINYFAITKDEINEYSTLIPDKSKGPSHNEVGID
ncbi:MAG: hypothetical protein SVZ03_01130 [Spirochaetota bacterium]|nr:hypothetical protein [Spirochaetota bacterium]